MVVLGRVVGPFGVRGWVRLQAFGDEPQAWCRMPHWWLANEPVEASDGWQPYALEEAALHGRGLIAKFAGIDDRDTAGALGGQYFGAPRAALPGTAADEYYWADLVGLEVVNMQGERLGTVSDLLSCGAHEVLCVRADEHERLLPFVGQVVKDIDVGGGVIRVDWDTNW